MSRTVKIWLCVALAVVLCATIAACAILGNNEKKSAEKAEDATTQTTALETTKEEPTVESTEETTEEPTAESTEETTAVPTDETTEEPAQEPTQQVTVPVVQGGTEIFNDAAFIGDSVTLKLRNYHMETGALGKTTFLCIGSYGVNNAVTNQLYLSYQGKDMTPQDALKACGAKKVFILLGMNDIALFGENSINVAMDNWAKLLQNIREKNPDIKIYIQSGTPIYTNAQKGGLNNDRMDKYNEALKEFAAENGCEYIDLAPYLKDSTNGLKKEYCSDPDNLGVHFTDAACELWINVLKNYLSK